MKTMNSFKTDWIFLSVVFAGLLGLFILASREYLDRPTVFVSVDTQQCVAAEDHKGHPLPCAEVLRKGNYERVYVVPRKFKKRKPQSFV